MDYTLHQYINGIKGSMAGSVSQSSPPHHHVLGSCRPIMREYIGKSEYFKRIKDECHNGGSLRENSFGVERDSLMDFKEYAKAITYAAMSDICTGGQIIVGRMSRGGINYHEINVAEVYLQNFDELENAPVILFAIQAEQLHQWMAESLRKFTTIFGFFDLSSR